MGSETRVMSQVCLASVVVALAEQVSTQMGNETVLLQMKTGKYFSLNRMAGVVWQQLQKETTVSALVDGLVARFEVDRARCEADVVRIVEGLVNAGFVEIRA